MNKILKKRVFRFIVGGVIAAVVNLSLMFLMIDVLRLNTPVLRNLANALSIELSLLFSFFVYRSWVWPGGNWTVREVLLRQIPLYHVSAGAAVITRILILFPILNSLGINYAINTMFGVLVGAFFNYVLSERLVFQTKVKYPSSQTESELLPEIYYPEVLAPALTSTDIKKTHDSKKSRTQFTDNKQFPISIVIPAYNEEDCIEQTIQLISQFLEREKIVYEVLVVNDNSRDHTETVLQKISTQNSKVNYINNYYPNGFGFAVRCGLENFQGDAVMIVMADGSDAPQDIVNYYYKLLEGYDCVFGSRFIKGGKIIDYPVHKLVVNRLANLFVQILFGLKYNDTTNAFKAYTREVVNGVYPLISHHFNLTVEIPLKAIIRGYSHTTVPISWRNRTTGISKLKLKEMGSRYLFIVLYIFLEKMLSRGDYVRKDYQIPVKR